MASERTENGTRKDRECYVGAGRQQVIIGSITLAESQSAALAEAQQLELLVELREKDEK